MITDTRDKILEYVRNNRQVRPHDLVRFLHISEVAVHRQLRNLIDKGQLQKLGKPPFVYYILSSKTTQPQISISPELEKKIDETYLYITPRGELSYGMVGFSQ